MSLVIHYWIGDVHDSKGVSASEMTYILSGVALNYSLIYLQYGGDKYCRQIRPLSHYVS